MESKAKQLIELEARIKQLREAAKKKAEPEPEQEGMERVD